MGKQKILFENHLLSLMKRGRRGACLMLPLTRTHSSQSRIEPPCCDAAIDWCTHELDSKQVMVQHHASASYDSLKIDVSLLDPPLPGVYTSVAATFAYAASL